MSSESEREPWSKQREVITPEIAKAWLEFNTDNYRNLSPSCVKNYAGIMARGAWDEKEPNAIQFDWWGVLRNGQHRLAAIKDSGVTLTLWVERGLDPDGFVYTDSGIVRKGGDVLNALGLFELCPKDKAFAVTRRLYVGLKKVSFVPKDPVVALGRKYESLITDVVKALSSIKPYRSETLAAFIRASIQDWAPKDVFEVINRFLNKQFSGPSDPLTRLSDKLHDFARRPEKSHVVYAVSVSAIRSSLEGKPLRALFPASEDFSAPWDKDVKDESKPSNDDAGEISQSKKSWNTRIQNVRNTPGAIEARVRAAEERGVVFWITPLGQAAWRCSKNVGPSILGELREFQSEITKIIAARGDTESDVLRFRNSG